MTDWAVHERLIFALDVADAAQAKDWIQRLGDAVSFYKIGLELLASGDYFRVLDALAEAGKRIFVDLKFHDVPATVQAAVAGIARYPVSLCTIHAQQSAMIEAAAAVKGRVGLLGVTVLTSMGEEDLAELGVRRPLREQVLDRARAAVRLGCDGVVASGWEAADLRAALGPRALIVCPGIRPSGPAGDDQKRTVGVAEAFRAGASHIVVGRPIRKAADPRAMAEAIQMQIAETLEKP
ncbi:MAG: orotidine 5'-phosphate decarboxylase [Lysobacteraceae bacterium]|nr:MAG: orotidine 5'-phosphate decarboxylase [Xanthomonadaceae bacterium]